MSVLPGVQYALVTGPGLTTGRSGAGSAATNPLTRYRSMNHDANFQAAYNAWQQDVLVNARTKLLTMADRAVATVGRAIEHDGRLAFSFLKSLGTLSSIVFLELCTITPLNVRFGFIGSVVAFGIGCLITPLFVKKMPSTAPGT